MGAEIVEAGGSCWTPRGKLLEVAKCVVNCKATAFKRSASGASLVSRITHRPSPLAEATAFMRTSLRVLSNGATNPDFRFSQNHVSDAR